MWNMIWKILVHNNGLFKACYQLNFKSHIFSFFRFWFKSICPHILSSNISLGTMKAVRWVLWLRHLSVKRVLCSARGELGGSEMASASECTREKGMALALEVKHTNQYSVAFLKICKPVLFYFSDLKALWTILTLKSYVCLWKNYVFILW